MLIKKKLSFKEAKKFLKTYKLVSKSSYFRLHKNENLRDKGIPKNPDQTYKNDWISWDDWLGVKK